MEINIDLMIEKFESLDKSMQKDCDEFLANEMFRLMDDYVPFDSGALKNTAFVVGDTITYVAPYANYLYQGKMMVDPITKKGSFYDPKTNRHWSRPGIQKELTSTPLHYKGEPQRGAKWAQRCMEDYQKELEKAVNRFVKVNL